MKKVLISVIIALSYINAMSFSYKNVNYNIISEPWKKVEVGREYVNEYKGYIDIPQFVRYNGADYEVVQVGAYAFDRCDNLLGVRLPNSVKYIENDAFSFTGSLEYLHLGDSVIKIGNGAFLRCGCNDFELPKSIQEIDASAFIYCFNTEYTIELPNCVEVGYEAFIGAMADSVKIGPALKTIEGSAFSIKGCNAYIVDENNENFTSVDGILFDKSLKKIIAFPANKLGHYTVSSDVSLSEGAFAYSKLTSISLPSKTYLPENLFNYSEIQEYDVPEVISTDEDAFSSANIDSICFPSIRGSYIDDNSFVYPPCVGLGGSKVRVLNLPNFKYGYIRASTIDHLILGPDTERIISAKADIGVITSYSCKPQGMNDDVFKADVYKFCVLRVPKGYKELYQQLGGWKNFRNIVEFDPNISGINEVEKDDLSWDYNMEVINLHNPAKSHVEVYNLQGYQIYSGNMEEISIPYCQVYIIRNGQHSRKIMFRKI